MKNNKDMFFRSDKRAPEQMRPVNIIPEFISTAEGSALIEVGNTRVICTASIEESVPGFMKGSGKGWITAEYSMLPRSTDIAKMLEGRTEDLLSTNEPDFGHDYDGQS